LFCGPRAAVRSMSETFLVAMAWRRADEAKAAMRKVIAERVRLAKQKQEEDARWMEQNRGIELGCWPVKDSGDLTGIGTGMLAAPFLPEKSVELKELFVGIAGCMVRDTVVHVPDDNAVVDWTYGNRTKLHSYLLCQLHQRTGKPGQHDHTFLLRESLQGNNFLLRTFELPDSILFVIERMLSCETIVFVAHSQKSITVYPLRPPGDELHRMTFRQLIHESKSLHERVTNQKPVRPEFPDVGRLNVVPIPISQLG